MKGKVRLTSWQRGELSRHMSSEEANELTLRIVGVTAKASERDEEKPSDGMFNSDWSAVYRCESGRGLKQRTKNDLNLFLINLKAHDFFLSQNKYQFCLQEEARTN